MAGWYDEAWTKRVPVVVLVTAAAGSPHDMQVPVPDFDDFWDNIKSAGEDIRLCAPDGTTLLTYQLTSFSLANRTLTIQAQNVPFADYVDGALVDGHAVLWLYWGNPAASDASTTFTASTPHGAGIYVGSASGPGWTHQAPVPGATSPRDELAKTTLETVMYWVSVGGSLDTRASAHNGSILMEGVSFIVQDVLQAGSSVGTMFSNSNAPLIVERSPGDIIIGLEVYAGTDANDYTISPSIHTYSFISTSVLNRVLNPRAVLRVNDVSEA